MIVENYLSFRRRSMSPDEEQLFGEIIKADALKNGHSPSIPKSEDGRNTSLLHISRAKRKELILEALSSTHRPMKIREISQYLELPYDSSVRVEILRLVEEGVVRPCLGTNMGYGKSYLLVDRTGHA